MEQQKLENDPNQTITIEYAKVFVQWVYDNCIDRALNEPSYMPVKQVVEEQLNIFSEETQDVIKSAVPQIVFCLSVLWFDYFDRHDEYQILIDPDENSRTPLQKGSGALKKAMMDEDGLISSLSSYYPMDLYRKAVYSVIAGFPIDEIPSAQKEVPDYFEKRPHIKSFSKTLLNEVYDRGIQCGYAYLCALEEIDLKNDEQRENLLHLVHVIAYDFILKAVGLFESYDFWLVEIRDGQTKHITYTDPHNTDFGRDELSSDIHGTEDDDMMNVFSIYGSY